VFLYFLVFLSVLLYLYVSWCTLITLGVPGSILIFLITYCVPGVPQCFLVSLSVIWYPSLLPGVPNNFLAFLIGSGYSL
jgi:hypothetical protein